GDMGTQTAAKAIEHSYGMRLGETAPSLDALRPDLRRRQTVSQGDGSFLPALFILDADPLPLQIVQKRNIARQGKRPLSELHRGAHIHQRDIVEKEMGIIGNGR